MKLFFAVLFLITPQIGTTAPLNGKFNFSTAPEKQRFLPRQSQCSKDQFLREKILFGQLGGLVFYNSGELHLSSYWFSLDDKNTYKWQKFESLCKTLLNRETRWIEITVRGNELLDFRF